MRAHPSGEDERRDGRATAAREAFGDRRSGRRGDDSGGRSSVVRHDGFTCHRARLAEGRRRPSIARGADHRYNIGLCRDRACDARHCREVGAPPHQGAHRTPARRREGVKFGRKPKLTPRQKREAIKRRDVDEETLRSIARSYNVSAATISRLAPLAPSAFPSRSHRDK